MKKFLLWLISYLYSIKLPKSEPQQALTLAAGFLAQSINRDQRIIESGISPENFPGFESEAEFNADKFVGGVECVTRLNPSVIPDNELLRMRDAVFQISEFLNSEILKRG